MRMRYLFPLLFIAAPLAADPAKIENVTARAAGDAWTFSVTLRHADTGWDDYADGWRILSLDGTELGIRTLYHPHVEEQPFTRSLSGVKLPNGTTEVLVEARTNTDGWSGERVTFKLPK